MHRDPALPNREARVSRRGPRLTQRLRVAAAALGFVACAGPSFTNEPSGGTGAASGRSGAGGDAGNAANGGKGLGGSVGGSGLGVGGSAVAGTSSATGGDTSTAGSSAGEVGAGGASDSCQCGPSQYCRAGTCFDCSDVSKLDFGGVEEVLDYPDGALRFPRAGDALGSLFFTLVTSSVSELWYAPDVASSPGGVLDDGRVPRTALDYFGDPGGLGFDVLFDETASGGARTIRAATFDGNALGAPFDAPPPFASSGADDYSSTLARETKRVYFMTTRNGAPELVTGTLDASTTKTVDVKVPAQGGGTCSRAGADATPWVTADGRLLLFSAPPIDSACDPIDGDATDVFVALLNPSTGLPLATAVPLAGINHSTDTSSESDASFAPDLCAVYFASDGGEAQGHDFRLYRALRR
jgi:hypothetical protein